MVILTLEDFNRDCKVDVEVKQFVAPPERDAEGNIVEKPVELSVVGADGKQIPKEKPDVKANLKAVEWADEVKVLLFGEGHILRTRDLLELQLQAYYQWINSPEPPIPPKDPRVYITRLQCLKDIELKVADVLKDISSLPYNKEEKIFTEQQRKAYFQWQETDAYQRYQFLQEEYLESLKPPPPPRDWSQKEFPGLLELQNEQFLIWYAKNRAWLENLLKPEMPVEEIPPPPQTPPRPPKDLNVYIQNMERMKEVAEFWKKNGPYVYWPDQYDPFTYYLELQRYWMRQWEYTEEYLILYRGVIRKKIKTVPWRALKWWEWKPISNQFKEERESTKSFDYVGLPRKALSSVYQGKTEKTEGEEEKLALINWDTETKKPYKSIAYNTELAEEPTKMIENRILWDKEPRPINMDTIYQETYEVIVKTQPNFI